ncbi:MAG: discoidin domain-containing protein [Anaerocolumna sp.]
MTQNVIFENLIVNNQAITSTNANTVFNIGSYANNVNFISSGDPIPATTPLQAPVPINLALNKTAFADSYDSAYPAFNANDTDSNSNWSAADETTGHWWMVDLGSNMDITGGTQVVWPDNDVYQYKIETSNDDINWTLKVDNTQNTTSFQTQKDFFLATARYVKITITGLPNESSAKICDFQVLGTPDNLALNKTASADSSAGSNPASMGADGNAVSLWSAADTNTGHWWKVDLGLSKNINYGTQVIWPSSDVYQYQIETSNDDNHWDLKVDKTDNAITDQVQTDYFTATARYVRITVTGKPEGSSAGFYDLKVVGDLTNLAYGKQATADSSVPKNPASKSNDGIYSSCWRANDAATGHWLTVDLGSAMKITNGIQIMWEKSDTIYQYTIETSTDNANWTSRIDKSNKVSGNNGNCKSGQVQADYFTAVARYVRITVYGNSNNETAAIYDFQVLGEPDQTAAAVINAAGGLATFMGPNSTMKLVTAPVKEVTWSVTDADGNPTTLASIDEVTGVLTAGSNTGIIKVNAAYSGGTASTGIRINDTDLKTVDNTDSIITYSQGSAGTDWAIEENEGKFGGSDTLIKPGVQGPYASEVKAEFTFTGTGVQWIGKLGNEEAKVDVYIDGIKMKTVDPYNNTTVLQHVNYSMERLDYGTHTIKLINTGLKNEAGGDYNLSVDAFRYIDPTIQSVALYTDKTEIGYGNKAKLSTGVLLSSGDVYDVPSGIITYTSSKPYVASVGAGVVTAINAGTTDITASVMKEGDVFHSNIITITVMPATKILVEADADVYSWKDEKQRNYGAKNIMLVQYNPKWDPTATFNAWIYHPSNSAYDNQSDTTDTKVSYLRFDVSTIDRTKMIKKAELKVSSTTDLSAKKLRVLAVNDVSWNEGLRTGASATGDAVLNDGSQGINFYGRPQLENLIVTGNGGSSNNFSSLDITDYVNNFSGNKMSVALESDSTNGTTAYSLNTKEGTNAAYTPYLYITYYTADEMVNMVAGSINSITEPEKDATYLTLPTVPEGYSIAIKSVTPEGIIGTDGVVTPSAISVTVSVVLTVTDTITGSTADTASINVTVPGGTVTPEPSTTLTLFGVAAMAECIRLSPVAGKGRYEIDMPPGENLLRDSLAGIQNYIFETNRDHTKN